jgi:hypothetical protein
MKLDIPAHDTRIHVFAVSDTDAGPQKQTFLSRLEDPEAVDTTLPLLFGHDTLDPEGAEVFAVGDVMGLGLRGYLAEAYDIEPEVLARAKARLDALGGDVIVLSPRALGRAAVTLETPAHIRHIDSFTPIAPDAAPRQMPQVDLTPPAPKDLPPPRRIPSLWVVVVVAVALLMIWLGQGG